jgi:hypothetical protein
MNLVAKNINLSIKNANYQITLNTLLEIIIREYVNLNVTLKITKKFILLLETIIKYQYFGKFKLSHLISEKSKHYELANKMPHHDFIQNETKLEVLDKIYLTLLNILVNNNIQFNFENVYIENRIQKINTHDKNILKMLKEKSEYMEQTILNFIGKINEIPNNYSVNSSCTIGEIVDHFIIKN